MGRSSIDLAGKHFGYLTVLSQDMERQPRSTKKYWICECECGNRISVVGSGLTKKRITDCGCRSKEYAFVPYGNRHKPKAKSVNTPKQERECSIKKLNDEGCALLLEAFVSNLSEDYYSAYSFYMDNHNDRKARNSYLKIRRFFTSGYFASLTGLDGNAIVEALDRINNIKYVEAI